MKSARGSQCTVATRHGPVAAAAMSANKKEPGGHAGRQGRGAAPSGSATQSMHMHMHMHLHLRMHMHMHMHLRMHMHMHMRGMCMWLLLVRSLLALSFVVYRWIHLAAWQAS